jgi:hypothetical protein
MHCATLKCLHLMETSMLSMRFKWLFGLDDVSREQVAP